MKSLKNFLNLFCKRHQEGLEESLKGSEFIFDSVISLYYHLQKTSLKRTGSSYIDFPKWLENKKATTNPKNNDNNCFQYALTVALNYQNIKKKKTGKEYLIISLLLVSMIGKK